MNNKNASRIMRCMKHNRWQDAWQWGDTYPISMLYCPVCDREERINKPKKALETLESLEAKVARYIKQHNLHNPKNKLRYCIQDDGNSILIRRNSGEKVCAVVLFNGSIQNTFNILKHRIREALKTNIDARPQNEKWLGEIKRMNEILMEEEVKQLDKYILSEGFKDYGNPLGDSPWTVFENEPWTFHGSYQVKEDPILPIDSKERKTYPIFTGVLQYFPRAIASVANQSYKGNQKHHPDKPLHWDKAKSDDHSDCLLRHLLDSLDGNCDKTEELTAVAWRALALLETHLEGK